MRGEYIAVLIDSAYPDGSSPHAWGIRHGPAGGVPQLRFIPTCVGNTCSKCCSGIQKPVHPHMRGEYRARRSAASRASGSSPHAWGIRNSWPDRRRRTRFIPTCVGNTSSSAKWARGWTVHPHMRGEYWCRRAGVEYDDGSSPHAWGIHVSVVPLRQTFRFIPTCVGNTIDRLRRRGYSPVHPHMRGEYYRPASCCA